MNYRRVVDMKVTDGNREIPVCDVCETPMWHDKHYYDIDGVNVCPNCLIDYCDELFKISIKGEEI